MFGVTWFALSGSLEQGFAYGILALGVYLTFRILNFPDLTVDGSFPLGAGVAATLIVNGASPWTATFVALLAGILTMTALYSINLRIMGRPNVPLLRRPTLFTNLKEAGFDHMLQALIVFAVVAVVLKFVIDAFLATETGLALRATGDNPHMIASFGVSTDNMKMMGLAFSNGLAALSGAMVAQYQGFADVSMGLGIIIMGLASVILGNVIIRPTTVPRGTVGVLLGSVIYRLAIFFALRAGFAPTDLRIVTAVIVILALSAPTIKEWRGQRRNGRLNRRRLVAAAEGVGVGAGAGAGAVPPTAIGAGAAGSGAAEQAASSPIGEESS